jgi:hypothetical protein
LFDLTFKWVTDHESGASCLMTQQTESYLADVERT